MTSFDAIVIGAGPAGSSAAREIGRGNHRVALLERSNVVGEHNVCGGGIEGVDIEEIGLPDTLIHHRIAHRDHHFPWGVTSTDIPHVTVLRRELDLWFAQEAVRYGAELMTGMRVREVTRETTEEIMVKVTDLRRGQRLTHSARLLIFADGPNTLAPRYGKLGFVRTPRTSAIGLTYELAWPEEQPLDHYEIHLGGHISTWGYIWLFPKRDRLNVGITVLPSSQPYSRHMEKRLRAFIESREDLRRCDLLRRIGGHIPVKPARRLYDNAMMVVGDAAGMVEALSEAGIANAVTSGRMAGQVACEALNASDVSAAFLSRYQMRWQATTRYKMIRFQARLTEALLPFSQLDKHLYAKLIQVLFLGDRFSRWQKLRLLTYPLLNISPTDHQ